MKCKNCGYEIKKPYLRTCPLCGRHIEPEDNVEHVPSEKSVQEEMHHETEEMKPVPEFDGKEKEEQTVCPKCHKPISKEAKFCPECGCNIKEYVEKQFSEPAEEKKEEPRPAPSQEPTPKPSVENDSIEIAEPSIVKPTKKPDYEKESVQPSDLQRNTESESSGSERPPRKFAKFSSIPLPDDEDIPGNGYDTAEIDYEGKEPPSTNSSSAFTWIVMIGALVGSILLGALLYLII